MSRNKILIIEDELIITETIASMLHELDYEVVGKIKTIEEAMSTIDKLDFDLVLLDINLDKGFEGIDIGTRLNNLNKAFIYLTSYSDDKTLEKAKKTMPDSYIVKPFNKRDLYSNIEIVLARESDKSNDVHKEKIGFKVGYKKIYVYTNDILWIKAEGIYLEIQTVRQTILQRTTFEDLLPKLCEYCICRVHRSWAVNLNFVKELTSDSIVINYQKIPISRSYRKIIKDCMSKVH